MPASRECARTWAGPGLLELQKPLTKVTNCSPMRYRTVLWARSPGRPPGGHAARRQGHCCIWDCAAQGSLLHLQTAVPCLGAPRQRQEGHFLQVPHHSPCSDQWPVWTKEALSQGAGPSEEKARANSPQEPGRAMLFPDTQTGDCRGSLGQDFKKPEPRDRTGCPLPLLPLPLWGPKRSRGRTQSTASQEQEVCWLSAFCSPHTPQRATKAHSLSSQVTSDLNLLPERSQPWRPSPQKSAPAANKTAPPLRANLPLHHISQKLPSVVQGSSTGQAELSYLAASPQVKVWGVDRSWSTRKHYLCPLPHSHVRKSQSCPPLPRIRASWDLQGLSCRWF